MSDKPKTTLVRRLKPGMKCLSASDKKPLVVETINPCGPGQYWIEWANDYDGSGIYFGDDEVVLAEAS